MAEEWDRFKADAARWIYPEQVGDPDTLGPLSVIGLMRRHRQLRAVAWFRLGTWGRRVGIRGSSWFVDQRLQGGYGLDLPASTDIGGGFYLAHPTGVAITADRIGENVTLVGGLTIGINQEGNAPVLGDNVYVGAGARVLGAIHLGDGVKVGANAVVLSSVAQNLTVVGAPARPTSASLKAADAKNQLNS